jgi:hypothetical protein
MVQSQNLQKMAKIANVIEIGKTLEISRTAFPKKRGFRGFPKKGPNPKIGKNAKKSASGSKKTYLAYMVMKWILCTPFFSAPTG